MLGALDLLFTLSTQTEDHEKNSENLIHLDSDSFDKYVVNPATNKLVDGSWLIMFYAPWCGHCKRLMPIFDEFAESQLNSLNVGRVNCDEGSNSNLCTAYDVQGFPTVVYINGDYFYEYKGERSSEGFSKFVHGGYETAESDVIPQKLEGVALY